MNRECLEKISRSRNVRRVTDCCECHIGWFDIGVLTRAVKTLSHVTEDPGETKILKPLPRVVKVF